MPASDPDAQRAREFIFADEDFNALRSLVHQHTGISLAASKRELVYGRLSRRLRVLRLESFREYRDLLTADPHGREVVEFCNAITTNLTSFFREPHHFDYLRDHILAPLAAGPARRMRIWSAGCSSGEEPYSIAMTLCESVPDQERHDIRILATDLDSEVLARGQRGVYTEDRVRALTAPRLSTFFRERRNDGARRYSVIPQLTSLVTFKQLNLMHELPMQGPLDVIFCRNVVIYFDKNTQRRLFQRFARLQRLGDVLFLGHSESLFKVSDAYTLIGRTIYRRNES